MDNLENIVKGSTVQTLVFDVNGTLAKDFDLFVGMAKKILGFFNSYTPFNFKIPPDEEIETFRGKSAKEVSKIILNGKGYMEPVLFGVGSALYFFKRKEVEPHEGIVDVVNKLSDAGYEILTLSSSGRNTIRSIANRWGLKYDGVYTSIRFKGLERLYGKHIKLKEILKERGWENNPEKVLVIADEMRDVYSCREAGVNIIPVPWGYNNKEAIIRAGANQKFFPSDPYDIPNKIKLVEEGIKKGNNLPTLTEEPILTYKELLGVGAAVAAISGISYGAYKLRKYFSNKQTAK
ncbi:MAG: HAD hydrolase-like protein [Candidatus Woesearchaeota archaeon]